MDKPFCPLMDELGKPCNRPMYANLPDMHYSDGVQITIWQCLSLNDRHKIETKESIPAWEEFRKERKEKKQYQGYKMTDERILEISSMLAKSIPQLQIAKELRCSCTTIRNVRGITLLAAVGAVLRGMR